MSEHIPEIIEYVSRILRNGFAYEASGSVYFNTQAFKYAQACRVPCHAAPLVAVCRRHEA